MRPSIEARMAGRIKEVLEAGISFFRRVINSAPKGSKGCYENTNRSDIYSRKLFDRGSRAGATGCRSKGRCIPPLHKRYGPVGFTKERRGSRQRAYCR